MRLPEFVTELSPVRETLEAVAAGERALAADTEEALRQVHTDTADRGLDLWEADFSLERLGTDGARRAAVKAALAGGRTLTPAYLEELCRLAASSPVPPQGGGNAQGGARPPLKGAGGSGISDGWSQVNEDFENWTVTAYAAAFGRLPPGAEALDAAVDRLKPAHLAVEVHPAGVFSLEGGWRSGLGGGLCAGAWGQSGEKAAMERRAALTGGGVREASGGDALPSRAVRRAELSGAACRELSGGDLLRAGAAHGAALEGGTYLELWGGDRRWDRFARRGAFLRGCVYAELAGK